MYDIKKGGSSKLFFKRWRAELNSKALRRKTNKFKNIKLISFIVLWFILVK